jgi:uncharacterized membrane protein YgdD (TMEM256/DUF423 family)
MQIFIAIGAFFCFLGVVAGALGAHALQDWIIRMGGSNNFDLATTYMFYHGLGLIAVGVLMGRRPANGLKIAGWAFTAGSLLFQGNLFLIAVGGIRTFQALTPVGGILLMAGWVALAAAALKMRIQKE